MNFDAFWQTHRRFLTGCAVGVLVFLVGRAIIGRTAGSDVARHERSIRSSTQDLGGFHVSAGEVSAAATRLSELEDRAAELARLALPPGPVALRALEQGEGAAEAGLTGFLPAPGQSPSQHYIEFTGSRRQELIGLALLHDVDLDESLGLPAESPTQPALIEKTLRGFFVVDRVVRLAVEAGAREVEDIAIEHRRRSRKDQVLDVTPVGMSVLLEEERLDAFLRTVFDSELALGLVGIEVPPLDKKTKMRRATLRFEAAVLPVADTAEEDLP